MKLINNLILRNKAKSILKIILNVYFNNQLRLSSLQVKAIFEHYSKLPNCRKDGYPRKNKKWCNGWEIIGIFWNVIWHIGGPKSILKLSREELTNLVNEDLKKFETSQLELNYFYKKGEITPLGLNMVTEMSKASTKGINRFRILDPFKDARKLNKKKIQKIIDEHNKPPQPTAESGG